MDETSLQNSLSDLPIGEIRYFERIGSTNDEALAWAARGVPDFSIIVADEQTTGRGRMGRKWFTPPGSALAFSLVLRLNEAEKERISLFSGLGSLALVDALASFQVEARIKWPNDVLINRRKVAGLLVESVWMGNEIDSVVLGMGINVTPASVPADENLNFPATCVHAEGPLQPERLSLLHATLAAFSARRAAIPTETFIRDWENALEFRGENVRVWVGDGQQTQGQIEGLETDGSLRLCLPNGHLQVIRYGEVHLRPL
jgi:BirA family biotin operon repressor/biotin-[acetyl-CoA-carboxylase] ligase